MKHEKIHGNSYKENSERYKLHGRLSTGELYIAGKLELVMP